LRRAGAYSAATIDDLVHDNGIRVAIVYDAWFPGALPPGWQRAGAWKIRNPLVVGSDTVTFYATSRSELPGLVANLREFETTLPRRVRTVPAARP
jgi:hypothetical protein